MNRLVFDIEADGLLDTLTEVYCLAAKGVDDGTKHLLGRGEVTAEAVAHLFEGYDTLIGHNIIFYDIPLLTNIVGFDCSGFNIQDTLIFSKVLNPDRRLPKGCPTSVENPITRKRKTITPHGLEAWGYRVGHKKIEIHDWTTYTPEILTRCTTDVAINEKVYKALLRETNDETV